MRGQRSASQHDNGGFALHCNSPERNPERDSALSRMGETGTMRLQRAASKGSIPVTASTVLRLQRTVGNATVVRLLAARGAASASFLERAARLASEAALASGAVRCNASSLEIR